MRCLAVAALLTACGSSTEAGCPTQASAAEAVAALAARGIPGSPDSARVRVGGVELLVVWKSLLSGRALTAACTWRAAPDGLRLVSEDLFDGTHLIALRPDEPRGRLRYLDARGAVIRELRIPRD